MADLGGETLDRARNDGERREEEGVAVARDDLGRDRLRRQAELLRDMLFDRRRDIGEGADGAGDGASRDVAARLLQPVPRALELRVVAGELQAEGRGLGMDAVTAADGERHLVLDGATLEH